MKGLIVKKQKNKIEQQVLANLLLYPFAKND